MLFNFLRDESNYKERKVANFHKGDLIVDTCRVSDGRRSFETGVKHPAYNEGSWVIVACYGTKEQAGEGHKEWVGRMTAKELPEELIDCANSGIQQLIGKTKFRIIRGC
jgi:hypothetical protein